MSKEAIELIKILKDETQSNAVFERCEAEIAALQFITPSPNANAWNTTVAGRHFSTEVLVGDKLYSIIGGEEVRIK